MNIKKVSFAAIASLALASATFTFAGNDQYPEKSKNMEVRSESMFDKVTLTQEQKINVQSIKDSYQPQLDALHESKIILTEQHNALDTSSPDYATQSQALKDQIQQILNKKKALKEQMQEETLQVLTPEQRSVIGK